MLNRLSQRCDKLALGMFYILMADVCIFGAGKLISIGPLSFRMILLMLTLIVCLPVMAKNLMPMLKSKYTWFIVGFAFWLIVSTVLGLVNKNKLFLLVTDWKGFLYFAIFPAAICLIRNKQRAQTLTKVMMYSAGVMAVLHILCILCYLWMPELLNKINVYTKSVHFFYVSYKISEVNVRINFLSLICQLFGCAFSVYYQIHETKLWKRYLYVTITAICLFAIWLSYTRSVYLAAGLAALGTVVVLFLCTKKDQRKRIVVHLCSSVVLFFLLITVFHISTGTNYFTYGLSRSFAGLDANIPSTNMFLQVNAEANAIPPASDSEQDGFHLSTILSDQLREATVNDLVKSIKASPIWGHGLGAMIPSRPDGLNEYFFLDLCSKTGFVGLALYLAPLGLMLWDLIRRFRQKTEDTCFLGIWFVVMLGFVLFSYFTPCMNSSVGIMCYCCAMAVFNQSSAEKKIYRRTI